MARREAKVIDRDEVDAEPDARDHLSNGLIIVTTLLLLGAFITMQLAMNKQFGTGMFGNASQSSTK